MNKGNDNYPMNFLYDSSLSLRAKGLMSQMLSYPQDEIVSAASFARLNGISCRSIYNIIKELEQNGYLKQDRRRQRGHYDSGVIYELYPAPKLQKAVKQLGGYEEEAMGKE